MRDFEDVPFEGRLGLEFRRLRRFLDLCQDEFGEQCNLTLSVVHNLEKGNTKCDLGTFREFFKPCGSYSLFMFLYASYGDNLRDKFQELFPEIPVEAFDEWVKILAKSILYMGIVIMTTTPCGHPIKAKGVPSRSISLLRSLMMKQALV